MTRRYWVFLILIIVFILILVLITQTGGSGEEQVQEPVVPTAAPTKEAPSSPERAVVPEPVPADDLSSSDITGAQHFTECAFRTSSNATIGVPAAVAQQGDLALEPGDEIAIFTPNGETCVGAAVWTGSNIAITAWGDDPQSEQIDGLQEGDELLFLIWDASAGEELELTAVSYEMGNGRYTADGIYVVGSFARE